MYLYDTHSGGLVVRPQSTMQSLVVCLLAAVSVASASTWGAWPYAGAWAGHGWAGHGSWAAPTVLPSGHLADTPEVAAAKSAHLAEVARQGGAAAGHGWAGHGWAGNGWAGHGAYAAPAVLPSGHLADTPEVAHAKAAHLAEVARQSGGVWAHGAPAAYGAHGAWAAPWAYAAGHGHEGQYVPDHNGW